jgi:PadR family transcriptional regulator PadR
MVFSDMTRRKRSHQTRLVLTALLDAPAEDAYGLEIVRASGVATGSCYAILRRLEDEGLLEARWERMDASEAGRPPRRYYGLTALGRRVAQQEVSKDRDALRSLAPGWSF